MQRLLEPVSTLVGLKKLANAYQQAGSKSIVIPSYKQSGRNVVRIWIRKTLDWGGKGGKGGGNEGVPKMVLAGLNIFM